jgi:PHD/YefM family antitoxin component YafN of YafNO toxin-antitoxin module
MFAIIMQEGINFIVDGQQKQVAVVIDLDKYGQLWEDFYDNILAIQRQDESRESLSNFKAELLQQHKL